MTSILPSILRSHIVSVLIAVLFCLGSLLLPGCREDPEVRAARAETEAKYAREIEQLRVEVARLKAENRAIVTSGPTYTWLLSGLCAAGVLLMLATGISIRLAVLLRRKGIVVLCRYCGVPNEVEASCCMKCGLDLGVTQTAKKQKTRISL